MQLSNVPAMPDVVTMEKIVSLARRRGFVFPSSEIYGGLGSAYDYGHYGVLMKENVKARWLEAMVREREDIVALDSSIILHPRVWEASGHVTGFTDPLVDCRTCKLRFRADHLEDREHEEVRCGRRPSKRPGETPECNLTEPRQFNLMFRTRIGAVEETGLDAYLRPETAQGIFVNFKNVAQIARRKPPFGIAQIGKAFRNEITPGNFIFRTLEFEQMEMEYFVPPVEAERWYRYWIEERLAWYVRLGIRESHLRVRAHEAEELSHYSSATSDIEYLFPIGWSELEGIANRGDYDLTAHTEASGTKLEWVDSESGERYTPYVVEPAAGVNRSLLAFLVDAYDEEIVAERPRTVLRLHPELAPVKVAVLPLIPRNEEISGRARALYEELRRAVVAEYDDSGQIGRRYRRQDEIGTPYALTIDEQTLEDDTVTIRDRDTLEQERIPISGARKVILDRLAEEWKTPKAD
jgi:glycyl-tRNA synthetase